MRLIAFWEQVIQDLRYALRTMARQPLLTAMATLSLALGIGASTAIFSFMDAILLRGLPVPNPESLVVLNWHSKDFPPVARSMNGSSFKDPKVGYTSGNFIFSAYELLRANSPVLSSLFAFNRAAQLNLLIRAHPALPNAPYISVASFDHLA